MAKKKTTKSAKPSAYKTATGLNYPDGKGGEIRIEKGETIAPGELPKETEKALIEQGILIEVE